MSSLRISSPKAPHTYMKNALPGNDYVTPLQRKDRLIRTLNKEMLRLDVVFDFKLKELNVISMYKDPTLEQELEVRNRQVQALRQRLEQLEQNIIEVGSSESTEQRNVNIINSKYANKLKAQKVKFEGDLKTRYKESKKLKYSIENSEIELGKNLAHLEYTMEQHKSSKKELMAKQALLIITPEVNKPSQDRYNLLRKKLYQLASCDDNETGAILRSMINVLAYSDSDLKDICNAIKMKKRNRH